MPTTTADISAFYAGSKPVDKLYAGSTQIWTSAPASYAAMVESLSPVSYWKLNEASGVAVDSSGNDLDGTWFNTPTYQQIVGGDGDSYPQFNSARVVSPTTPLHNTLGTGFTWTALIRPEASGQWTFFSRSSGSTYIFLAYANFGTDMNCEFNGAANRALTAADEIPRETWSHVVVSVGPAAADEIQIYVNGVDVVSSRPVVGNRIDAEAIPITLGSVPNLGALQLQGHMAHAAMYQYQRVGERKRRNDKRIQALVET